jgi:taurine transport system substrate-binding protein
MNMRPPEIAAAWERGDIDAAFIWDPVLTKIKGNGKVIASSKTIGAKGLPHLRRPHRQRQVGGRARGLHGRAGQAAGQGRREVPRNKAKWTVDSPEVKAVAKWTKADPKDVPATMALYTFPTMAEQVGPKWLGGGAVKAMTSTAAFLKEQGRIQEVKPDYAPSSPTLPEEGHGQVIAR